MRRVMLRLTAGKHFATVREKTLRHALMCYKWLRTPILFSTLDVEIYVIKTDFIDIKFLREVVYFKY